MNSSPPNNIENKKKRKNSNTGVNRSRSKYFKTIKLPSICLNFARTGTCSLSNCKYSHDINLYLSTKPADISVFCHLFNSFGLCPSGYLCRFANHHIQKTELNGETIQYSLIQRDHFIAVPCLNSVNDLSKKNTLKNYTFNKSLQVIDQYNTYESFLSSLRKDSTLSPPQSLVSDNSISAFKLCNNCNYSLLIDRSDSSILSSLSRTVPYNNTLSTRIDSERDCNVISNLSFKDKLILAPLATVGNLPFRRICSEFGADITCSEMVMVPHLLSLEKDEWKLIQRHPSEKIFGVQLCDSRVDMLSKAVELLSDPILDLNIDYFELNCGCPLDTVCSRGCGSEILRKPKRLENLLRAMYSVSNNIPITLKTRLGIKTEKPILKQILPKILKTGVSAITIHGRSQQQRYSKLSNWDYISECADFISSNAPDISVNGNGDIISFDDYNRHRQNSNISGCMIGRGALVKPWIFTEIKEKRNWDISANERKDLYQEFVNYGLEFWGSDEIGVETTRHYLLEWLSFASRYVPFGLVNQVWPLNQPGPNDLCFRNELEALFYSNSSSDWVKISELFLGPVHASYSEKKTPLFKVKTLEDEVKVQSLSKKGTKDVSTTLTNTGEYFIEFCLRLILLSIKKAKNIDDNYISMLDPLVPYISQCISLRSDSIHVTLQKCMSAVARYPMPSLFNYVEIWNNFFFTSLLHGSRELAQRSFSSIATMLNIRNDWPLTSQQASTLLNFVRQDLLSHNKQSLAFSLVKAFISRRFKLSQLNDAIRTIMLLLVQGSPSVQHQASSVLLLYFLDYPRSSEKIKQEFDFLVTNLDYDSLSGRKAILEFIGVLFSKIDSETVNLYAMSILLRLVLSLGKESDPQCQQLSANVISAILSRVNETIFRSFVEYVLQWISSDRNIAVRSTGIHLTGILFISNMNIMKGFSVNFFNSLAEIFHSTILSISDSKDNESIDSTNSNTYLLFRCVSTFYQIFQSGISPFEIIEKIWDDLLLAARYEGVISLCKVADKIIIYFLEYLISNNIGFSSSPLNSSEKVHLLVKLFVHQLEFESFDPEFGELCINCLFLLSKLNICVNLEAIDSSTNEKKLNLDGNKIFQWIFNKDGLSHLTNIVSNQALHYIFLFFQKVFLEFGNVLSDFLYQVLYPLYRCINDQNVSTLELQNFRSFSQEVMESIQKSVGEVFIKEYDKVLAQVNLNKQIRKRKIHVQALVDPENYSRRKIQKNVKNKERRKRKILLLKEQ